MELVLQHIISHLLHPLRHMFQQFQLDLVNRGIFLHKIGLCTTRPIAADKQKLATLLRFQDWARVNYGCLFFLERVLEGVQVQVL